MAMYLRDLVERLPLRLVHCDGPGKPQGHLHSLRHAAMEQGTLKRLRNQHRLQAAAESHHWKHVLLHCRCSRRGRLLPVHRFSLDPGPGSLLSIGFRHVEGGFNGL